MATPEGTLDCSRRRRAGVGTDRAVVPGGLRSGFVLFRETTTHRPPRGTRRANDCRSGIGPFSLPVRASVVFLFLVREAFVRNAPAGAVHRGVTAWFFLLADLRTEPAARASQEYGDSFYD